MVIPRLLQRVLIGGATIYVPTAIGLGATVAESDPGPAIYWFTSAGITAVIAIVLWDEVTGLSLRWRIAVSVLGIFIVVIAVWMANQWVEEKSQQRPKPLIAQAGHESRAATLKARTTNTDQTLPHSVEEKDHGTTDSVKSIPTRHGTDDKATVKVDHPNPKDALTVKRGNAATGQQPDPRAFAVAVETRWFVPASLSEKNGTGFWLLAGAGSGCSLISADIVLYIRITNLQPAKTLITAYNVYSGGLELNRLKTNLGVPYLILSRGTVRPHSQKSVPLQMPVPESGPGRIGGFLMFPLKDADPSVADPIEADFLDRKLGELYIESGDSVRGWAFFQYPQNGFVPAELQVRITDDLGQRFTYQIPDAGGNPSGDTLLRLLTLGPSVDLSSCIMQPHPSVLP